METEKEYSKFNIPSSVELILGGKSGEIKDDKKGGRKISEKLLYKSIKYVA